MAENGLSDKEKKDISKSLAISERLHAQAERISPQRRAYSEIISILTKKFDTAVKSNNFDKVFELEKIAQEHDSAFHVADKEKTLQVFGAMDMLQKQFLECSDPERVKEWFMPSIVRLKMQGTRMKDRAFDATENSVCGFINSFKSARCVPAENAYYAIRTECIKAVQKEHQRNIDRGLGFVP